ncbi:MAG: class I SAM-dependent methyltransferase [Acidobacteria bacterium]|nr:class I SAM-dependent methyltransferase [Acidobacteriota bacterium]
MLTVEGWALPPDDQRAHATLALNGRPFEQWHYDRSRPDLEGVYGFIDGAGRAGFSASTTLTADEVAGRTPIEFDLVDGRTLEPFRSWQQEACWPEALERFPVPEGARIKRVHGAPDEAAFRIVGYSNFRKIARVLDHVVQRPLSSFSHVLDWGCGSGRLLRYLLSVEGLRITGADIDDDNLAWCREHLPATNYVHLPLHPPSALPDAAFDLAIGLSIFTHLTESVQFEWLGELRRVTRPGAILLMSIHGPTVHAMTQSVPFCDLVEQRGIVDSDSHDLDDVLEDKTYYRTTQHSHAYVRREWSRYFEVLDILPACIGNVQDLVVLRRRVD